MKFSLILVWVGFVQVLRSQQPISEFVSSDQVLSPQVYPEGDVLGYPFIELGSGQVLDFHFDLTGSDRESFQYGIIHCSHAWIPSDLEVTEYISGFPFQPITEVEASFGTRFDYVHYMFNFPNDMSKPMLSGNYAAVVFKGDDMTDRSAWIVAFRFVVYEMKVRFRANVHSSSIIRERFTNFEVDCELITDSYRINDPYSDLHLSILCNGDWGHAVQGLPPVFIKPDGITFDYNNGENSFAGGAEWREFDTRDLRFSSMYVEGVLQDEGGWVVKLRPSIPNGNRAHESRIDINGKYIVQSQIAGDSNLESEYVQVDFTLNMPESPETKVCIEGNLSRYSRSPWVMHYDETTQAYRYSALLKQGYYNYRYVMYDLYHPGGDTSFIEGDYVSTENDYHVLVYHFDRGLGCDRVIGIQPLQSGR